LETSIVLAKHNICGRPAPVPIDRDDLAVEDRGIGVEVRDGSHHCQVLCRRTPEIARE
jgi:hypothetical protein